MIVVMAVDCSKEITHSWSYVKAENLLCEQTECIKCKEIQRLSVETFFFSVTKCLHKARMWFTVLLKRAICKIIDKRHLFLLGSLSVTCTNCKQNQRTIQSFVFSEVLVVRSHTRRVKAGLSLPWRFFLRAPLKVSFVAPDVLCSYLFCLWTGQQKAAGIMMERQNHSDIVAGPYKRLLYA